MAVSQHPEQVLGWSAFARRRSLGWVARYQRRTVAVDAACGLLAGLVALLGRFAGVWQPGLYVAVTGGLPVIWVAWVAMFGGYDPRFIGLGSEEFRRILNAAVSLTAAIAIVSYAFKLGFARGYVLIALPSLGAADTAARYAMRKRLHRRRAHGRCMRRTTAVGHAAAVADLIVQLRRDHFHGLEVVNACLDDPAGLTYIKGVPVIGGFPDVARVAASTGTDTVAVLACPEMDGITLRRLAWDLEKEGTDLCVAPALLDVAGPRTTIRPVAGLPLLHVDHAELSGAKRTIKSFFDMAVAAAALGIFSPLFAFITIAIVLNDGGPVLFTQTRIGKDGQPFTVHKFRTMVPDAELRKEAIATLDEGDGLLFKIRRDPRVTATGSWLRRWSLDELPQLFNVMLGEMSLVGPRPPLPSEVARYGEDVRRRLVVKPGMTGLWQVNGRSDLSRERRGPARPAVRGELVTSSRPADPVENVRRGGQGPGSLLTERE